MTLELFLHIFFLNDKKRQLSSARFDRIWDVWFTFYFNIVFKKEDIAAQEG